MFVSYLGFSYYQVGECFGHSTPEIHEWYTALYDLFETTRYRLRVQHEHQR